MQTKFKSLHFLFILPIILTLLACGLIEPGNSRTKSFGPHKIAIVEKTEKSVSFLTTTYVPTPCWEHTKTKINRDGKTYLIKMSFTDPGEICVQSIGEKDVPVKITVPEKGTYKFSFWTTDSTTNDTTLTF